LLKSQAFPGLWLDVKALLRGNLKKVLATLQPGLKVEEKLRRLNSFCDPQCAMAARGWNENHRGLTHHFPRVNKFV
jgi:hypothetical protein